MNFIEFKNLNVDYRSGGRAVVPALREVSFCVDSGEYVCIVGCNGSGKSTLIKSLLGLVPVASGSVRLGCDRGQISYLPQCSGISADFPATVAEIVLTGTQNNATKIPFYRVEHRSKAESAMRQTQVYNLARRRFGELSGGQQQRVLLARAIAGNPLCLVLDEPCVGLDPASCEAFYELLHKVNIEKGVTVLMATHDMDAVRKYASKVVVLHNRLLFCGSVSCWEQSSSDKKGVHL